MANQITATYSFTLPEVGADTNAWGGHLNGNFSTIDQQMLSRTLVTSQTMLGPLNLPSNGLNVGSGQLQVTGGNVSTSGNASIGGTFGVTGATSLGNTVVVNGAATFDSTVLVTGAATFSSTLSASTAPSTGAHLTNKTYVDAQTALKLNLAGGTMTGVLTISSTYPKITLTDTNGYNFSLINDANACGIWRETASAWGHYVDSSGNFVASGNVTAYSDARLKENVQTIRDAVALVSRMRGVFYDRVDTGKPGVGVIAQEMQEVVPAVVHDNGDTLSVAYGNLVGVLIEAVKELSARVETLEGK
jgi:hypothetical protein